MPLFKPTYNVNSILEIPVEFFKNHKINSVLIDIDDTLTSHGEQSINSDTLHWIELLRSNGINLILVSNNFKKRVSIFAKSVGLPYVHMSLKPLPWGFSRALKRLSSTKEKSVIIGDQLFTDILGANLVGIRSVLVEPRSKSKTLMLKIKRYIENPIRKKFQKNKL